MKRALILIACLLLTIPFSELARAQDSSGTHSSRTIEHDRMVPARDPFVPPLIRNSPEKPKTGKMLTPGNKGNKTPERASKKSLPPDYALTGIITGEKEMSVIVYDEARCSSHLLSVGMMIGAYKVTAIHREGVEISRDSSRFRFFLKRSGPPRKSNRLKAPGPQKSDLHALT